MLVKRLFAVLFLLTAAVPAGAQIPQDLYSNNPLVFEPNVGQAATPVRFLSRGNGHAFLLTGKEAVLTMVEPAAAIRMTLVGQSDDPVIEGLERQRSVTHFLAGNNPERWHRSVPQFKKVRYGGVYPGIDLVYYGDGRQLEYDFIVSPQADPSAIQIEFQGADRLSVGADGDLILTVGGKEVRHKRPVAYQEFESGRRPVEARFLLRGNRVRFQLGRYDKERRLIVDPKLLLSSYLGGAQNDQGNDVALDSSGNIYVTGYTVAADVDPAGALVTARNSTANQEAFVTKIDPSGALVYSTYIGGAGNDESHSLGLDKAGSIYITGFTTSSNFPVLNAFQATFGGVQDAYIVKLSNDGSAIQYSSYIGGAQSDRGYGIAVDADGNAVIAGQTLSSNFPVLNAFQSGFGGGLADGFITKVSANGTLAFSTYLGAAGNDQIFDVVSDADGDLVVTGFTTSQNFPTANAIYPQYRGGPDDIFIAKLSGAGNSMIFSTYFGGSGSDNGVRLAVDKDKNIYVTGYTSSFDFPLKNPAQILHGGISDPDGVNFDAFLVKLHPGGGDADFSTYIGADDDEGGVALAVDAAGNIHLVGFTNSIRFYAINAIGGFLRGLRDAFVMKVAPDASVVLYSTYLGGFSFDGATAVALDSAGNAYVTGFTNSLDFPVGESPFQKDFAGIQDGFIVKINADDIRTSSAFDFPSNGGFEVFTAGQTAQPIFGYGEVGVGTGLTPSGLAIVDLRSAGTLVNEVSVPLPKLIYNGRVYAKTALADTTALSIVNPSTDEEVEIGFFFTTSSGETSNFGAFRLPPRAHTSALLFAEPWNIPIDREGTLTFKSTGPIAAVGLRVDTSGGNPINSHLPIADLDALPTDDRFVVPQFVDGQGWNSHLFLMNTSESAMEGQIRFFSNRGPGATTAPFEISSDRGTHSVFAYSIPPRGLYTLLATGAPAETVVGFASIEPAEGSMAPLAYSILFFNSEAGFAASTVKATETETEFEMYVETSGAFPEALAATPALALANPSDVPVEIDLELLALDGTPSGLSGSVTLAPKGHFANFLSNIEGFEDLPGEYQGVLRATSSAPGFSFAGFRTRYNERELFLALATGPLPDLGTISTAFFPHLVDGGGYATQFILINGLSGAGAAGVLRFRDPSGRPLNLAIAE